MLRALSDAPTETKPGLESLVVFPAPRRAPLEMLVNILGAGVRSFTCRSQPPQPSGKGWRTAPQAPIAFIKSRKCRSGRTSWTLITRAPAMTAAIFAPSV